MRERLEMVGGHFHVQSAPGQGTAITAQIPPGKAAKKSGGGSLTASAETKLESP